MIFAHSWLKNTTVICRPIHRRPLRTRWRWGFDLGQLAPVPLSCHLMGLTPPRLCQFRPAGRRARRWLVTDSGRTAFTTLALARLITPAMRLVTAQLGRFFA